MGAVTGQDIQSRFQHGLLAVWRPQVYLQEQQVYIPGWIIAVEVFDTVSTGIEKKIKCEYSSLVRTKHVSTCCRAVS